MFEKYLLIGMISNKHVTYDVVGHVDFLGDVNYIIKQVLGYLKQVIHKVRLCQNTCISNKCCIISLFTYILYLVTDQKHTTCILYHYNVLHLEL